jgi:hypothetical protein
MPCGYCGLRNYATQTRVPARNAPQARKAEKPAGFLAVAFRRMCRALAEGTIAFPPVRYAKKSNSLFFAFDMSRLDLCGDQVGYLY